MTHFQTSLNQDLRTALHKAVSKALHNNQFADGWHEMVDPVVDAVLALTALARPDHAGGVEDDREGIAQEARALRQIIESGDTKLAFATLAMVADDLERQAASPAQAPDKAAEREGVKGYVPPEYLFRAELVEAMLIAAFDWQKGKPQRMATSDDLDGWRATMSKALAVAEAALAPKPTGTEAGRGVGADVEEKIARMFAKVRGHIDLDHGIQTLNRGELPVWDFYRENAREVMALLAPTPPTPDSTGQSDGASQEGTAAPVRDGTAPGMRLVPEVPTENMIFADIGLRPGDHHYDAIASKSAGSYRLMVNAAPEINGADAVLQAGVVAPVRDDGARDRIMVPFEPTDAMVEAGRQEARNYLTPSEHTNAIWQAMIEAAPAGDVPGEAQTTPDSTAQGGGTSQEGTR